MNLPYSEEEITKIKNDLKSELQLFKQRELPESAFTFIIDGYHCEVKDNSKVKQTTCNASLGIDLEGKKTSSVSTPSLAKKTKPIRGKCSKI